MDISYFLDKMASFSGTAVVDSGAEYSFQDILAEYESAKSLLENNSVPDGAVVSVLADFKPLSIAMILALIQKNAVIVPIAPSIKNLEAFLKISQSEYLINLQTSRPTVQARKEAVSHPMLLDLKQHEKPGLILFSSGTTGEPKAALHDLSLLLEKFKKPGKCLSTVSFLLFDHIGGFNTMMHTLVNGGMIVTLKTRTADEVCSYIEKYKLQLLPASPTFINLIILNKTYEKYDLSSLQIITYGTEPMPETTLKTMHRLFPDIKLKQTYGVSEVGIVPTKSESSESLWLKLGG